MEDKEKIYFPHSEARTVFYPSSFVFKENIWGCSIAYKDDIILPEVVSFREFTKDPSNEITPSQLETVVKKYLPAGLSIAGIAIQSSYIQLFMADSLCPMWVIRDMCGDDFEDYIKNMFFDSGSGNDDAIFYFECHDIDKVQIIIENYKSTIDKYSGGRANTNLRAVYYDNYTEDTGDDYYFFVFLYSDLSLPIAIDNVAEELGIQPI